MSNKDKEIKRLKEENEKLKDTVRYLNEKLQGIYKMESEDIDNSLLIGKVRELNYKTMTKFWRNNAH